MLKKAGESTGLEFNSPAHGNWNIVHTGMLLPESIQIYVCADNCMRGVVLTAAEMNAADRFSFVIVEEEDLLNGNLEDVTIEGVTDVLRKRKDHPKAFSSSAVIWIQSCKSTGLRRIRNFERQYMTDLR